MSPIRILFMSPLPPPFGGIATWTDKLIKYGLPDGFAMKLVDTSTAADRKTHEKVTYGVSDLIRNVLILYRLVLKIIEFKPHAVHLNCSLSPVGIYRDYMSAVILKICGTNVVTSYHGNVADFSKTAFGGRSMAYLSKLINISNVNIVLNKPSYDFIQAVQRTISAPKSYLFPNFIDDHFFNDGGLPVNHRTGSNTRLRGISVGSLTKAKGAHDIAELAVRFKDMEFIAIGNITADFRPLLNTLPNNLKVMKPTSHENVIKELGKSDFFLLLSHTEGFPNAVLEAMAMKLPVIATRVGAIPEMIDEGQGGYLCNPGDLDQVIEAIDKLIRLPDMTRLGRYNFNKAKNNYSYSKVIDKLCGIYTNF